ncbi:MAG: hypothetical protein QOI80_1436 [Solirubrobacteraceae bacterium]|jgi:hypothetical protein|nr:hypothetical protein [Solirubrobacteraceae bacterium]
MAYVTSEARQELVDTVAEAAGEIGTALAALAAAYEALDEASADTLEEALFRPVQLAFGRAKRTVTGFAERHGLPPVVVNEGTAGLPSRGVKGFVEDAAEAIAVAESILTELQDSLSPVEVGDAELRAGLADVRERLAIVPAAAEHFISRFGR